MDGSNEWFSIPSPLLHIIGAGNSQISKTDISTMAHGMAITHSNKRLYIVIIFWCPVRNCMVLHMVILLHMIRCCT